MWTMVQEKGHFHTLMVGVKMLQSLEYKQALTGKIEMHVPFDPKILLNIEFILCK